MRMKIGMLDVGMRVGDAIHTIDHYWTFKFYNVCFTAFYYVQD